MGLSVAKLLSFKGANIVLVSRSVDKLEDALKIVKVCMICNLQLSAFLYIST
jgi:short-subunit dehydrogenase